jgi:hypothetical protein
LNTRTSNRAFFFRVVFRSFFCSFFKSPTYGFNVSPWSETGIFSILRPVMRSRNQHTCQFSFLMLRTLSDAICSIPHSSESILRATPGLLQEYTWIATWTCQHWCSEQQNLSHQMTKSPVISSLPTNSMTQSSFWELTSSLSSVQKPAACRYPSVTWIHSTYSQFI